MADRLFYSTGIHAVGVDRVIAEAGVAKASLYAHFRSKDDLVVAYLQARSTAWQQHAAAELAGRDGADVDRVLLMFDLLTEWFAEPGYRGCPFINAAAEYPAASTVTAVTHDHRAWVRSWFEARLAEADSEADADESRARPSTVGPDRRDTRYRDLAAQLTLLYDGAMVAAQLDEDPVRAGRNAREAAAGLVERGIA